MISEHIIDIDDCTDFRRMMRMKTPKILHMTTGLLVGTVVALATWMWRTEANLVVTGIGRVRPISGLDSKPEFSSEVSAMRDGRVSEINVKVGDKVKAGTILARLDTVDLELQKRELQEQIDSAEKKLSQLKESNRLLASRFGAALEKGRTELKVAEDEYRLASDRRKSESELARIAMAGVQGNVARLQKLIKKGAVSKQKFDEEVTKLHESKERARQAEIPVSDGNVRVRRQSLELTRRDYELEKQKIEVEMQTTNDAISDAKYRFEKLERLFAQSVIKALADCVITKTEVKVGDMIKVGRIGMTAAPQRGLEFEVRVAATDVAHLKPNMRVQIKMDAYDYQKYGSLPGHVRSIAPDSTMEEMGSGGRSAVYKIKITLDTYELRRNANQGYVKLGMTGKAEIVTDRESILVILLRKMNRKISLS